MSNSLTFSIVSHDSNTQLALMAQAQDKMHAHFTVKIHTSMFGIDATFNSGLNFICNMTNSFTGDTH